MRFLPSKKTKLFLRNSLVSLLLSLLCFFSIAPAGALAQTQPTSPTNQQSVQQTPTTPLPADQKTVTLPNGQTETGLVKQCGVFQVVCDTVGDALGGLGGAFLTALKAFFGFVMDQLAEILLKIFTFILHIIHSVLGGAGDLLCKTSNQTCITQMNRLAQVDPFLSQDLNANLVKSFNLFTLVDSSYSSLYSSVPKISGTKEVASVFQNNFLGVGKAYAQGQGTSDLTGVIKNLWEKMRDLAYIVMVLALVVIGFMIMLRRRLDPKTVVTATNTLPKIAIALVLITFSFALSGFFLDMIYLLVNLTRSYFGSIEGLAGPLTSMSKYGGELVWLPFLTLISKSVFNAAFLTTLLAGGGIFALFTGVGALAAFLPLIAFLLIDIIIRLGLFVLSIMLFWELIKRYATMIVLIVFSPFFFLAGAIPGFDSLSLNWFKRMGAAVLTFPAILILVYLALAFLTPLSPNLSAPPPIGGVTTFLNIEALIGLGVLYFAVKIPGAIDELFNIKDTRQRGPTPFILASGALAGGQTISSVSKAAPTIGGWASGMAGTRGPVGFVAGGLTRAFGAFDPNVNGPVRDVTGGVRRFTAEDFEKINKKPSDFNAQPVEKEPGNYVLRRLDYARFQRHGSNKGPVSEDLKPKEKPMSNPRFGEEDTPPPEPIVGSTGKQRQGYYRMPGSKYVPPTEPEKEPKDPNL